MKINQASDAIVKYQVNLYLKDQGIIPDPLDRDQIVLRLLVDAGLEVVKNLARVVEIVAQIAINFFTGFVVKGDWKDLGLGLKRAVRLVVDTFAFPFAFVYSLIQSLRDPSSFRAHHPAFLLKKVFSEQLGN
ncbi:MAG: hypothetical protein KGJ02_05365 [Verrucomicrobiota bacterium]|nr:hypothetical protein [Verrucomicrobiota bacterium]